MNLSALIPATLAALTLTGVTAAAQPATVPDGAYVTRTVRSNNGKDPFVRVVKIPKAQAVAETRDCPMMGDQTTMREGEQMRGGSRDANPAPKG